jgi:hypothetical protein
MSTVPPLLQGGGPLAADTFVRELSRVLASSAADAAALHAVFERGPRAVADDAVAASRTMQADATALNAAFRPILAYTRDAPKPAEVMAAAEDVLCSTDKLLDSIEKRLHTEYGIEPVVVAPLADFLDTNRRTSAAAAPTTPGGHRASRAAWCRNETPRGSQTLSGTGTPAALASICMGTFPTPSQPFTPLSSRNRAVHSLRDNTQSDRAAMEEPLPEPDMPSTPNMLDFGIDDRTLPSLTSSYQPGNSSLKHAPPGPPPDFPRELATSCMRDSHKLADDHSSHSIHLHNIHTPVQVAGRFAKDYASPPSPLRETPQQLIDRVDARFAMPTGEDRRQALVFSTPEPVSTIRQTRSHASIPPSRCAVKLRVEQEFHSLPNFLRCKLPVSLLQQVCNLLHDAHESADGPPSDPIVFELADIMHIVADVIDADQCSLLVMALTKLLVLKVEKMRHSVTQYVFDGQ